MTQQQMKNDNPVLNLKDAIDTKYLNMDFMEHYTSGDYITVEFPDGRLRSGTVGVTQGRYPQFVLMVKARQVYAYDIGMGCRFMGEAKRKTRSDCVEYLNGRCPVYKKKGGGGCNNGI